MLEHIYHKPLLDADELFNTLMEYADMIKPYVIDSVAFMHNAIKEGKKILLEGQLGSLKDPDFGIYPMTTSSSTLAGYGAVGAGIPPYEITDIITVVKHIHQQLVQVLLFLKSSVKKLMNLEDAR